MERETYLAATHCQSNQPVSLPLVAFYSVLVAESLMPVVALLVLMRGTWKKTSV